MGSMDFNTNVLLLGKTGVGKSSLLNYLFGENVAETGSRGPVTKEGIHKHDPFNYNGLAITLYDSWGLEPDKGNRWKTLIHEELKKHDTARLGDWFHTIIYCIDAQRSRIDDFEFKILDELFKSGNRAVFALTRADVAKPEELRAVENELFKRYPDSAMIPICSVGRKLMTGKVTEPAGKENLINAICKNLSENLFHKALALYEKNLHEFLERATFKIIEWFNDKAGPLGFFTSYGDDFRKKMEAYIRGQYEYAVDRTRFDLQSMYDEIVNMEVKVLERMAPEHLHKKTRIKDGLRYNETPFLEMTTTWDNSFESNLAELIASLIFLPLMPFMRKGLYRDDLRKCCDNLVCQVKDKHGEVLKGLRRRSIEDENFMVSSLAIHR